jgi:hypothetical protein
MATTISLVCRSCGKPFEAARRHAAVCSPRCQKRLQRRKVDTAVVRPVPTPDRPSCAARGMSGKRYEWPSGLRRLPPNSKPTHQRPYGPFGGRAEWLAWCHEDAAQRGARPVHQALELVAA